MRVDTAKLGLAALEAWVSSPDYASDYKHIPIAFLEPVREMLKKALDGQSVKYRLKWRGPRGGNLYSTPKSLATHFDVYLEYTIPPSIVHNGFRYRLVGKA